jgi:Ca2+-binding RTX toxin-like protein
VNGGSGNTLDGGRGDDTLICGEGADTLVFGRAGGTDAVHSFEAGTDMILLDGITLRKATAADLDGNGTLDTLLRFSSGTAEFLDLDLTAVIASDPDSVFIA